MLKIDCIYKTLNTNIIIYIKTLPSRDNFFVVNNTIVVTNINAITCVNYTKMRK
jgi:hypothetical protein